METHEKLPYTSMDIDMKKETQSEAKFWYQKAQVNPNPKNAPSLSHAAKPLCRCVGLAWFSCQNMDETQHAGFKQAVPSSSQVTQFVAECPTIVFNCSWVGQKWPTQPT